MSQTASREVATLATNLLRGTPPARTPTQLLDLLRTRWPELVEATATWLVSEGRDSIHTRSAYASDVSWWLAWCDMIGADPTVPSPLSADQYGGALAACGLAKATRARRLSGPSSWYEYLVHRAELVAKNPFKKMTRPKADPASTTRGLADEQVRQMLEYAEQHETARTFAILSVLAITAVRVGAVINANVEDVGFDAGQCVLEVREKGDETRMRPLPAFACAAVDRYHATRDDLDGRNRGKLPLFATSAGGRIDGPYVRRLIRRVAAAAGIPGAEALSPHSFRHSFATNALAKGVPLHHVQDALGHKDPRTTRRYDHRLRARENDPTFVLAAGYAPAANQETNP